MSKLSNKIINKINSDNIKPIPKWKFMLHDTFIWTISILSAIIGGIGLSIIIFLISNNDILNTNFNGLTLFQGIILLIPFFWIFITLFFIFLSYYNFKHTNEGYKWNVFKMLGISLMFSIIIGLILYFSNISLYLNNLFEKHIPYYTEIADTRNKLWNRPEFGYLSGTIESVNTDNKVIKVIDFNNNIWIVNYTNAFIRHSVSINNNEKIKIIGEVSKDNIFNASEIRPWQGKMNGLQEK